MAEEERMNQVVIAYPEDVAQTLQLSGRELGAELAFLAAAKLYELGRLSAGRAARLAGLSQPDFLARLANVVVPATGLAGAGITAESAGADDVTADLRLQRALVVAGLTGGLRPLGARAPIAEPPPLQLGGTPLSESIVAERR